MSVGIVGRPRPHVSVSNLVEAFVICKSGEMSVVAIFQVPYNADAIYTNICYEHKTSISVLSRIATNRAIRACRLYMVSSA